MNSDLLGWSVPAHLVVGIERNAALEEACDVVAPVLFSFFQAKTGAFFVLGALHFAVVERHGPRLYRNRFAVYPSTPQDLVAGLQGVECVFFNERAGL